VRRRRALRIGGATLGVLFVGAQLVHRPDLRNPPVVPERRLQAHVQVPPDVDSVLRRACYDCHSGETRWPAYARVAPVSWLVARDVRQARADLDFSAWDTDPDREPTPSQRLGGICSDLRRGIMPLRSYVLMHPRARVSPSDVVRVCEWTDSARARLATVAPGGTAPHVRSAHAADR
jgi:hypothetical protein